ncbi:hypothetical protein BASA60_004209 [Batrachochytrium salamandrivorans]|nr:hypothetical protein BASA60_004209 [Batrachochytrium salamandrivorans]
MDPQTTSQDQNTKQPLDTHLMVDSYSQVPRSQESTSTWQTTTIRRVMSLPDERHWPYYLVQFHGLQLATNETMSERTQRLKTAMKAAQWASEAAEEAKDTAEARSYLEWIVENSLVLDSEHSGSSAASDSTSAVISAGSLRVNPWASPRQTGMALEQLGHIYADSMLMDWAIPVYQRALEMLNQDKDLSFLERQCRSAILHNNLAECLTKFENNKEALSQALQLASISIKTLQKAGPAGVCGECDPIAHYNLGAILDKLERRRDAIDYFKLALVRSQNIGFVQGIEQANLALNKPASTVTNP